jgi:hypothetical protein
MREEVKTVKLDRSKQGLTLTALVDFRNGQLKDGQCVKLTDEVINDIFNAPARKKKVRSGGEAR